MLNSSVHLSQSGEIGGERELSASDCMSDVDLERGDFDQKLDSGDNEQRDCRICHLGLESCGGVYIVLGCSCKGDLGSAHKKCAETWFKIKGNMICEICGTRAVNVGGDQRLNEATDGIPVVAPATPMAPLVVLENQSFWHGRRLMNFLLACMVFAFIISWLFHFKVIK